VSSGVAPTSRVLSTSTRTTSTLACRDATPASADEDGMVTDSMFNGAMTSPAVAPAAATAAARCDAEDSAVKVTM